MDFSIRQKSVLVNSSTLETLYVLKKFPIFVGCVDTPFSEDDFLDLSIDICQETGILQLKNLASLDQVYLFPHNDAIGSTWEEHNDKFIDFIQQSNPKNILEIGGGSGKLAINFLKINPDVNWTILDPNTLFDDQHNISTIKKYFTSDLRVDKKFDVVIHSHVFEHQSNPEQFLIDISKILQPGSSHIFSFPNLQEWLNRKYLNCLNFEHTIFLTESYVDILLQRTGFTIIKKSYFRDDHSIFYYTKYSGINKHVNFPNLYHENKTLYLNYIQYFKNFVSNINSELENFHGKVYLFGAHIFSQYLLNFGLNQKNLSGILDNSSLKIGKRLYGTNLKVFEPKVIKNEIVGVILKVGSYRNEIVEQLKQINPNVVLFE